jgi:hypothetical protein
MLNNDARFVMDGMTNGRCQVTQKPLEAEKNSVLKI